MMGVLRPRLPPLGRRVGVHHRCSRADSRLLRGGVVRLAQSPAMVGMECNDSVFSSTACIERVQHLSQQRVHERDRTVVMQPSNAMTSSGGGAHQQKQSAQQANHREVTDGSFRPPFVPPPP